MRHIFLPPAPFFIGGAVLMMTAASGSRIGSVVQHTTDANKTSSLEIEQQNDSNNQRNFENSIQFTILVEDV
jgi:hypothetical protein